MIDFDTIDPADVIAKGRYSIVRLVHEESKKRLALLCGQLASITSQILHFSQPDKDAVPDSEVIANLIAQSRDLLEKIEAKAVEIEGLAQQRAALKVLAWD